MSYKTASGNHCCNEKANSRNEIVESYKTASGNHCCNKEDSVSKQDPSPVTKPQAVITVAACI